MADLNALIAQGYQFQAPPDPFAQYAKMQQLDQGEQANQLNRMKMQEYQRGMDETNAMRRLDPTSATYLQDITRINPEKGFAFAKMQQEAGTARTEGDIKRTKLLADKLAMLPDAYRMADTPEAYLQLHESIHADPVVGPYLKSVGATPEKGRAAVQQAIETGTFDKLRLGSMQNVSQILESLKPIVAAPSASVYDPTTGTFKQAPAAPAAATALTPLAKLQNELAALPPGDSRRAQYIDAIRKETQFAPAASTTVNVSTEKAYGSGVAAGAAKEDLETINRSRAIPQEFAKIDETLDVLKNTDINTGLGADLFTVLDKARAQVAADKKAGVRSVNTEYLDSLLGSAVFPQIQALGIGARGMDTPAEREFLRKVMTGSVGLNKDTLIKMTELRRKGLENEATQFNKRVQSGEFKPYEEAARRKVNAVEVPQIQPSGASKIPGQGQTPAAPAAARTVTRTGTLNRRRVIEYSDGSTEYGN